MQAAHLRYLETTTRRFSYHGADQIDRQPLLQLLRSYYVPEGETVGDGFEYDEENPDDDMYSSKNLLRREALRFDPHIVHLLQKMWSIFSGTSAAK